MVTFLSINILDFVITIIADTLKTEESLRKNGLKTIQKGDRMNFIKNHQPLLIVTMILFVFLVAAIPITEEDMQL